MYKAVEEKTKFLQESAVPPINNVYYFTLYNNLHLYNNVYYKLSWDSFFLQLVSVGETNTHRLQHLSIKLHCGSFAFTHQTCYTLQSNYLKISIASICLFDLNRGSGRNLTVFAKPSCEHALFL